MTISAKDLGDKVLSLEVGWIASARQPLLGERMPVRDRNLSAVDRSRGIGFINFVDAR